MKLKKIASLMLAGIMAVSMLAACGSTPVEEDPSSSETPTTGVSATFANFLTGKRVEFKDNATYAGYLADGLKEADPKSANMSAITSVTAVADDWNVFKKVEPKFDKNEINYGDRDDKVTINNFASNNVVCQADDELFIAMYAAPGSMKQDVVLEAVAADLDYELGDKCLVNYNDVTSGSDTKRYNYDYTGSVSMQKVEDGSVSAWYVLVTLYIDATEVKK